MTGDRGDERRPVRLALIGGGMANATFVIALADHYRWLSRFVKPPRLDVTMYDRNGEFGGGRAYGGHTSPALLMNNIGREIGTPGLGFIDWLRRDPARWQLPLQTSADPRTRQWWSDHEAEVTSGRFHSLFLPRHLFGDFLREQVRTLGHDMPGRSGGQMSLRTVTGDVTELEPATDGAYRIRAGGLDWESDIAVLGLGGQAGRLAGHLAGDAGYLSEVYEAPLATTENKLRCVLAATAPGSRRIVVAGSSHSGVELLYVIGGRPELRSIIDEIVVVSPSDLPDGTPSRRLGVLRTCALDVLSQQRHPTAASLFDAARTDVRAAAAEGIAIFDHRRDLEVPFSAIFERLTPAEKQIFVSQYGRRYVALIRWTSTDYALAIRRLMEMRPVRTVRGRVVGVDRASGGRYRVAVEGAGGVSVISGAVFADCAGFVGPGQSSDALVRYLLATGVVSANPSGEGLVVNETFEAAPRVFVQGALLVGLSRGTDHIWHFDSNFRIALFAIRMLPHVCAAIAERAAVASGAVTMS
jgi:uncharacterized NAD(P)/FAD-binding protein YdhS